MKSTDQVTNTLEKLLEDSSRGFDVPMTWLEPGELTKMLDIVRETQPTANIGMIRFAYYVAEQAHEKQSRESGEPYITHPLAVATILAEMRMDEDVLCAALLHDVLEDCPTMTAQFVSDRFGEEVLNLVSGVTKLQFQDINQAPSEGTKAAENMRKMLLAMANDYRVMVIKLADRLHNMTTLASMPEKKRIRISNETLDIYAPLAARLGIWQVKWQLEDLAFQHLHPTEYKRVKELVSKTRSQRERDLQNAIVMVKERLEERGMKGVEVQGRPKHLYSIYLKMAKHGFKFEEIMDLLALRVIVDSKEQCYQALGVVHDLWVPIAGMFTDYIGQPKFNGYQSIHTKVIGPHKEPLEVQIRTYDMHEIAEYGVAAHADYKEGRAKSGETERLRKLREQLFDWDSDSPTSSEFLRSISTDMFTEQVFVFTPKGEVLDLPKGSTPVDFAFRVHTEMGLTTVGAKINGIMSPLSTKLKNGDIVELITQKNAMPSPDWLKYVRSSHARNKLRAFFRKINKEDDAARGKGILEKELKRQHVNERELMNEDKLSAIAHNYPGCKTAQDVLAGIGNGLISVMNVATRLRGQTTEPKRSTIKTQQTNEGKVQLRADGVDNVMLRRARCCDPVPGEDVIGYVTRGRGIQIHRKICPNGMALFEDEPERFIDLDWPPDGTQYPVTLLIQTADRQGLLGDISQVLSDKKVNIAKGSFRSLRQHTAEIAITIDVDSLAKLNDVVQRIAQFQDVFNVLRTGKSKDR